MFIQLFTNFKLIKNSLYDNDCNPFGLEVAENVLALFESDCEANWGRILFLNQFGKMLMDSLSSIRFSTYLYLFGLYYPSMA